LDSEKIRLALPKLEIEAPRGKVRIDGSGHIISEALLGRIQPDNGIETIAKLGWSPAQCVAT
jgi:hypothetical protein